MKVIRLSDEEREMYRNATWSEPSPEVANNPIYKTRYERAASATEVFKFLERASAPEDIMNSFSFLCDELMVLCIVV